MPYKCEQCPHVATTNARLTDHANRVHQRIKDIQCPHCDVKVVTKTDLDHHVKRVHLKVKRFKCSECEYGFYHLSTLKQHVKSVHDKVRDHTCDLCDYAGSKKNSLVQHMKRHHDRCPGCDDALLKKATEGHEKLQKATAFSKSLSIKGSCNPGVKSYTCGKCNFAAVHKEAMAWHMTKVHNERIKCPHCNYLALQQWSIKVHVKTKHTNERDFKCEHCDQAFVTTSLLRQHKKKVHDLCSRNCPKSCKDTVKSLKCDLCPFAATHMDALYHHKNLAHRNKEGTEGTLQTFSCDKCPHQALSQERLIMHQQVFHNTVGEWECLRCDLVFRDRYEEQQHNKTVHSRVARFNCGHCKFAAYSPGGLKTHIKIVHEKIKDFKCGECSFETSSKVTLKNHVKREHTMRGVEVLLPKEEVVWSGDDCEISEDHSYLGEDPISITDGCPEQGKVKPAMHDKDGDGAETEREVLAIQCGMCNYVTNKKRNLKIHKHNVHKEFVKKKLNRDKKMVQCPQCPATFSKANNSLNRHLITVHSMVRYTCDLCGKTFGRKGSLRIHKGRLHPDPGGSKHIVNRKGSKLDQDSLSKQVVHKEKVNHDKNVVRKKKESPNVVPFVPMVQPTTDRIQCPQCPASFSKASSHLKRHLRTIHSMLRHSCDLCNKTFGRKDSLIIHKGRLHPDPDGSKNIVHRKGSKMDKDSQKSLEVEERMREQSPDILFIAEIQKSDTNMPDITEIY